MKFITDRLAIVCLGLLVIVVGLVSPKFCKRVIFEEEENENPVETRRRHREAFLAQHREMIGE